MIDKTAFPKGKRFRLLAPHWLAGTEVEVYGYTSANIRAVTDEGRGLLVPAEQLATV